MLGDATQTFESQVWPRPSAKLRFNRRNDVAKCRKIAIVQAAAANEFPHSLNRIEFRTVRRQKVQTEMVGHFLSPRFMERGVVVPRVIDDDHGLAPRTTGYSFQLMEELPTGFGVKHTFGTGHDQLAVSQTHGSEKADAFARRGVQANGICYFGRHPHAATGAMLLEMHFIHGPQINLRVASQAAQFFCVSPAIPGRLGPLGAGACVNENPIGGIAAGIAEPLDLYPVPYPDRPTELGHPTFGSANQTWQGCRVRRTRPRSTGVHSSAQGVRDVRHQTSRITLAIQIAEPNSPPCAASHLIIRRLAGRLVLERPAGLHAADDHSARRRYDESHLEWP